MAENFDLDVAVVGAGFGGVAMLYQLRERGLRARAFEAGSGVGGTWFWNRYPGARCDIESLEYSYQFSDELQQEWEWSERYATQPEILSYVEHVVERFGLGGDIQLNTRVTAAHYDEATRGWRIETERDGDHETTTARFCVMATGCLSSANEPDFPGKETFSGPVYHTGRWPHEGVDFTGKRVAVIGTGSSGIQSIPLIAEQARHLTVFQRTPNYSIPAYNGPLDPEHVREVKSDYESFRAYNAQQPFGAGFPPNEVLAAEVDETERERVYEERWKVGGLGFITAFGDLIDDEASNATAAEFVRNKIRAIVTDPETAEKLMPKTLIGCKRLCVDTDYYATYNRDNVSLVSVLEEPIETFTPTGIVAGGVEHPVDCIVLATGFDAMTGAVSRIDIRGRDGLPLGEKWSAGPRTYLGIGSEGFPNLFLVTGPGSPSVLSNMVPSIEQHARWISDCIAHLRERKVDTIEVEREAEDAWVEHVNEVAAPTVYPSCNSWYLGANVPGKPRVFMPYIGFPTYVEKCDEVARNGYEGFELR